MIKISNSSVSMSYGTSQMGKVFCLIIPENDICITDMAGAKHNNIRAADVIKNWMRNLITYVCFKCFRVD